MDLKLNTLVEKVVTTLKGATDIHVSLLLLAGSQTVRDGGTLGFGAFYNTLIICYSKMRILQLNQFMVQLLKESLL